MNFDYPSGATPLDPDEIEGLLLSHITNRSELDRWEQDNIMEAEVWAFRRKPDDILSAKYVCLLHKRMFKNVWRWAGEFRRTGKNIDVEPWLIGSSLKVYWRMYVSGLMQMYILLMRLQPDFITVWFLRICLPMEMAAMLG